MHALSYNYVNSYELWVWCIQLTSYFEIMHSISQSPDRQDIPASIAKRSLEMQFISLRFYFEDKWFVSLILQFGVSAHKYRRALCTYSWRWYASAKLNVCSCRMWTDNDNNKIAATTNFKNYVHTNEHWKCEEKLSTVDSF